MFALERRLVPLVDLAIDRLQLLLAIQERSKHLYGARAHSSRPSIITPYAQRLERRELDGSLVD